MYINLSLTNNKNGDFMELNLNELLNVTARALSSLITLFLVTKMLGKKQVSQLSLFDYVIGISIGNFAAEMTINLESNEINGILAVIIFGFVAYIVSIATMKSIVLRRFFIGTPTILIQNGKILEKNLRKVKFDVNDLLEEIRTAGYFDLSEVEYAVMEVNGNISVLPKAEYKSLTPKDMNIKVNKESICANVIIDGKIMHKNLENMNKNEKWLNKELKVKGYSDISKILLATLDNNEKLNIYERNNNIKSNDVFE